MEIQRCNTSFGMAMYNPKKFDMPYFMKYLARNTGKIDTEAYGELLIKQAKNKNADIRYVRSADGEKFEVFSVKNPKDCIQVPIKTVTEYKNKVQNFFSWLKEKRVGYEYIHDGDWKNLPDEIKKAAEIANKMNEKWAK